MFVYPREKFSLQKDVPKYVVGFNFEETNFAYMTWDTAYICSACMNKYIPGVKCIVRTSKGGDKYVLFPKPMQILTVDDGENMLERSQHPTNGVERYLMKVNTFHGRIKERQIQQEKEAKKKQEREVKKQEATEKRQAKYATNVLDKINLSGVLKEALKGENDKVLDEIKNLFKVTVKGVNSASTHFLKAHNYNGALSNKLDTIGVSLEDFYLQQTKENEKTRKQLDKLLEAQERAKFWDKIAVASLGAVLVAGIVIQFVQ